MINAIPAGFVKMGNRLVPAQTNFGQQKVKVKKFLLVIQHYEGDRDAAEQLASLIADLERTRNHDADVMLMRRADSRELSAQIVQKLQTKFGKVILQACRRIDARGHPFGPNQMWSDLLMLMAQNAPFATDYYAFLQLEADVTPTRPGWIGELIAAIKVAMTEGKAAIGFIHDNPVRHLNGVAVYAADIYRRAGGNVLAGGSPQIPYDIRHRTTILPMAKETPLIYFRYRQPTIMADELFAVRSGIAPAIYHGVKDGSARAAVRARHITFADRKPVVIVHQPDPVPKLMVSALDDPQTFSVGTESDVPALGVAAAIRAEESAKQMLSQGAAQAADSAAATALMKPSPVTKTDLAPISSPTKRPNVYTYSHKHDGVTKAEMNAILAAWTKGWTSRGWNPVVLTLRDAAKHAKFEAFQAAVEKLPCVGDRKRMAHRFYRWLALDVAGGGLLTDWDVLPDFLTPDSLPPVDLVTLSVDKLIGAQFAKESSARWVEQIMRYDAQPTDLLNDKPHVTDLTIARNSTAMEVMLGVAHFANLGTERKSVAMERFLAGK